MLPLILLLLLFSLGRCDTSCGVDSLSQSEREGLKSVGDAIKHLTGDGNVTRSKCLSARIGGIGSHQLCRLPLKRALNEPGCLFYSFGIGRDASFDRDLVRRGCSGFAFDPTLDQAPVIQNVTFFPIGADMLFEVPWVQTNVSSFKKWRNHKQINVLKMDCEGCEYALSRDVLSNDPSLFRSIDQFAVEVHVANELMGCREFKALGSLYSLLSDSGLTLKHASLQNCGRLELSGCPSFLDESTGYPCSRRHMCHNLLFSRDERQAVSNGNRTQGLPH